MGIPAGRQRALLASLALRSGHVLSTEEIAERLWGVDPPAGSRTTIRSYVMRLRRVLDSATGSSTSVISSEYGGYQLRRETVVVDADQFRALTARAVTAPDRRAEAELLDEALSLWRGEALAGVVSDSLASTVAPAMEEERLTALHRRIALRLKDGGLKDGGLEDGGSIATELPLLREILTKDPFQERFWALLIEALHVSGREAEALWEYGRCREILAESLGTDPGAELRQLHQRILAGEPVPPSVDQPNDPASHESAGGEHCRPPVPMQLPPDVRCFVGRVSELGTLTALLANDEPAGSLTVVDGPAGMGKTGLAVHWAHRNRARYPDGQLYADLHGYGPKDPTEPTVVLRAFLRALGVPSGEVPEREESRSALFRSLLSDRRMLVVLDNARSGEQIRPLLPGGASTVLVTSRNQMRGLVAGDGAFRVSVPPLSPTAATELLRRLVPPRSYPFTESRLAELAELCWRSPLLLRTMAERLARFPGVRPASVIAEIREAAEPLSVFPGSEDRTDMRTVLSWSFDALTPTAVRLFRLLCGQSEVGATSFVVEDAATLLSVTPEVASGVLDELAEQHLLTFLGCGVGYGFTLPVAPATARDPLEHLSRLPLRTTRGRSASAGFRPFVHSGSGGM